MKIAKHSESLGFDSMVAGDHVVAPIDPESQYPYSVSSEVPWDSSGEHLDVLAELAIRFEWLMRWFGVIDFTCFGNCNFHNVN